jgi:DNA-binding MarR family transcriptional regulator
MRAMNSQLSLLSQRISGHLDLRGFDLQCLDLIEYHGALTPSALARLAGLHPATMTGIVDRLERDGWIERERDHDDRRSVILRPVRARRADVLRLTAGMNAHLAKICADYTDAELDLIAEFLRRTAEAGRTAIAQLDAQ